MKLNEKELEFLIGNLTNEYNELKEKSEWISKVAKAVKGGDFDKLPNDLPEAIGLKIIAALGFDEQVKKTFAEKGNEEIEKISSRMLMLSNIITKLSEQKLSL